MFLDSKGLSLPHTHYITARDTTALKSTITVDKRHNRYNQTKNMLQEINFYQQCNRVLYAEH